MDSNLRILHETETRSDPVEHRLYIQLIGSLMYLIHLRPDIFYAVSILSQFMTDPKHRHQVVGKHIFRYLRGTIACGLRDASNGGVLLLGYIDSHWGGNIVDQNSTSRYCFSLGSAMISWSSRKQGSISQSTEEAEYISTSTACREVVWMRKLLGGLFGENIEPTVIMCDNHRFINISEIIVFHDKSKHIEMKYHFI